MSPAFALGVVAALLVLAVIAGAVLRRREGLRRAAGGVDLRPADAGLDAFGARATLVQFSTETCARCPQVRRMLSAYARQHADVVHGEIDLTGRPDLAARYRVLQTPTTFLVDGSGAVRARFHGVPQRQALSEALAALPDTRTGARS